MEIVKLIAKDGTEIDTARLITQAALAKKWGLASAKIYIWKVTGKIQSVNIAGSELLIEPKEKIKIRRKALRKEEN